VPSFLGWLVQFAKSRDDCLVARAAPRPIGEIERVIGVTRASGPRRIYERILEVLLDVLDAPVAHGRGVLVVERLRVRREAPDHWHVPFPESRGHIMS